VLQLCDDPRLVSTVHSGAWGAIVVTIGELSEVRATRPARRIRGVVQWLAAPLRPFFIALFPARNLRTEIVAARYGLPLLSVVLCACVAAFAVGARLDVGPSVRAEEAGAKVPTPGAKAKPADAKQPELKTDREIDEEIGQRATVARVKLGMAAALATPARILLLGLVLLLLGRYIGGKPTMPRALTLAALASVPGAVRSLLAAVVAWHQPRVFPDELDSLVQFPQVIPDGHPVLARLFAGIDIFTWWSVVILAIGICAAADVRPRKGITAIAVGFVLYLLVTRLIMGGGR
jgi:hypothetical protein